MATIVISPYRVVKFLNGGGGHCWVYLQYALGLRALGCDVYWLERVRSRDNGEHDASRVAAFLRLIETFGLGGKAILYTQDEKYDEFGRKQRGPPQYLNLSRADAEAVFRRADLLLNFHYAIDPELLAHFRRTALVDIDPGLLQFWIGAGQLRVPRHDVYLATAETVGSPDAKFPDCGLPWMHIRPPICLDFWPYRYDPACEAFTTVSNWAGHDDWLIDNDGTDFENTKRIMFLRFAELPLRTTQPLELALFLGKDEPDIQDRQLMERHGWRIRHSLDVVRTPESYQGYIQNSRGEFSCAKPSYVKFQTGWVSDRTLCYLASGKPAVVQNTGTNSYLPNGEGVFRFTNLQEAAEALETINANYPRHCRVAREVAETHFDARAILPVALSHAGL